MTNEEWFNNLSVEEKARRMDCGHLIELDYEHCLKYRYKCFECKVAWLKQERKDDKNSK